MDASQHKQRLVKESMFLCSMVTSVLLKLLIWKPDAEENRSNAGALSYCMEMR